MKQFIGIVGSNSRQSTNRELLQFMQQRFESEATIEIIDLNQIPLFDKPSDFQVPAAVTEIAAKITAADGVIISTPEYDHSVPAVLTSLLAWLSYKIYTLLDKPVMIIGASYGGLGSSRAQSHLRQILDAPEIKARVMPSSEFLLGNSLAAFDEHGQLKSADQVQKLDGLLADFLVFVGITEQLNHAHEMAQKEAAHFSWENL
ncbi:NADPH-dependent FMN reductase [Latilactobacillus fuchuensis]|uniref:Flavin reductase n=1 Tax=Latilactobacillus fuchuensis TaxID=164393 RepID=A0A2N9DXP0_9LACO|nr:NADPH-dependent FMN reductase [Latilactobacillus fuchuensis]SPC39434.1 Flavin reductase [Latilactobacillus fuchuensis]